MKYIVVILFLWLSLHSDEIQRIESIVKDITELRKKYQSVQEQLYQKNIEQKNQNQKILLLQNQIKKYRKQLKTKEKKIKKQKINEKQKLCKPIKVKQMIIYRTEKSENSNKFPKLIMKPIYAKYKNIRMKAKTYHLVVDSNVYNAKNGKKLYVWDKETTFTSNEKAVAKGMDTWVKVTGYFIDGSWVPSKLPMWIKYKYIK